MGKKSKNKANSWRKMSWWEAVAVVVLFGITCARFMGIRVPVVDELSSAMFGKNTQAQAQGRGYDLNIVDATMENVRNDKPIDLVDFLHQFRYYCGGGGGDCYAYMTDISKVFAAIKRGPGTWNRKALKKAQAREIDDLLVTVANSDEGSSKKHHLKLIAKELMDVTPRKLRDELKSTEI